MARRRILGQLYPSYLLITLIALVAVAVLASHSVREFYQQSARRNLQAQARLIRTALGPKILAGDWVAADSLCKELGRASRGRFTVLRPNGTVGADSKAPPGDVDVLAVVGRSEIRQAFEGEPGTEVRYSQDLRLNLIHLTLPVEAVIGGHRQVAAVIWGAMPLTEYRRQLNIVYLEITLGVLVVALLFALVSMLAARRISRPLEILRRGAEAFARGELDRALPVSDIDEIASLARSMNQMAAELDERIRTVTRHRNELQAILLSMVEGVLVVDRQARIVSINLACAQMLGLNAEAVRGRHIQEVLRNPDLQELVEQALGSAATVEGEIALHNEHDRYFQVHGTLLRDTQGKEYGGVLVLNDVTRLRGLEKVRQDFVGNVTHELKTPITSIKAAVETLMSGAIDDESDAERFLAIIARQASRLNAIIEDLLSLSRIEEESGRTAIERSENPIDLTLAGAVQACESRADEKRITLEMSCDPKLHARINPALLENAVVNLIDNAIKYSDEGTLVRVVAYEQGDEIVIDVVDQGCGIDKKHHERIFERFYLVDKARSRRLGATGLGLSIVKHIVRAHGGRMALESTPGEGSIFSIILPRQ